METSQGPERQSSHTKGTSTEGDGTVVPVSSFVLCGVSLRDSMNFGHEYRQMCECKTETTPSIGSNVHPMVTLRSGESAASRRLSQEAKGDTSRNDRHGGWGSSAHSRRHCGGCGGIKVVIVRCVVLLVALTAVQRLSSNVVRRHWSSPTTMRTTTTKRTRGRNAPTRATNIAKEDRFDGTTAVSLEDLADISHGDNLQLSAMTWDEAMVDRGPILQILQRFGLNVTLPVLQRLPTWTQVSNLYGDQPVVWDPNQSTTCATFRNRVDLRERFVGVAGQMNTGTNALSKYLTRNIYMAHTNATATMATATTAGTSTTTTTDHVDSKSRGILWTVPWYKHGWASLRSRFRYHSTPANHANVMAVVVIRDPYFWMQSMCASPYTLIWKKDTKHCPQLIESTSSSSSSLRADKEKATAAVSIRWSHNVTRTWPSLAHVWSSWYREYYDDDDSPRIFVRFEDLLFHTESVVNSIRECVGASWIDEHQFRYIAGPAKTHPYFAKFKPPTSLISAMIKYGQDDNGSFRRGQMTEESLQFATSVLDTELIEQFHYQKLPKR